MGRLNMVAFLNLSGCLWSSSLTNAVFPVVRDCPRNSRTCHFCHWWLLITTKAAHSMELYSAINAGLILPFGLVGGKCDLMFILSSFICAVTCVRYISVWHICHRPPSVKLPLREPTCEVCDCGLAQKSDMWAVNDDYSVVAMCWLRQTEKQT